MTTTQRRLLFVGHPDAAEVSQWTSVRDLASQLGWETTRRFSPPDFVTIAIATDDVLGGVCTPPSEASTLHDVTASSIPPCMRAGDALVRLFDSNDISGSAY